MASTPVLGSRKALLSYLTVACEIEQGLCLQYLFTAFSLKDDFSEGGISTLEQLTAVRRWKADLFLIAAQEMLHLTQAANLSTAAGGTVQLGRPNFPQGKDYYPTQLPWQLAAFSSETIARYVCYERPSDEALARMHWASFDGTPILAIYEDIRSEAAPGPFADLPAQRPARARDAATVGEIYEAIAEAFQVLPDVIIGPEEAQIDGRKVDFTQVVKVLSRDDARAAVELIIHQGEGTKSERQDSHFGVFLHIYNQFVDFQKADPSFQPVRPVCTNPLSKLHVDNTFPGWRLIDNKSTRAVNDLCSSVYETMLLMLYRFFATPAHEEAAQRKLSAAFLRVMTTVIKPLGEALTKMPMGKDTPAPTAGPSFEIDPETQLLPHPASAWRYMHERLLEDATRARSLASAGGLPSELGTASATLFAIAGAFGPTPPSPERI